MRKRSFSVSFGTALVVLLVTGCGDTYNSTPARDGAEPSQAAQTTMVMETTTVLETTTVAGPAPAAERPPAPRRTERATKLTATEAAFWRLIAETRSAAGNDTGRQSELLKDRLARLSPTKIVSFWRTRRRLDRRAYTWRLWGAAAVIEDGCSDDCFRDFRGYVISLGRGPYERALRNPDSLASVAADAETGDWENADDVAPDAYSSATGDDFPLDDSDLSGRPTGKPLDLGARAGLVRHYPRLAARFRN